MKLKKYNETNVIVCEYVEGISGETIIPYMNYRFTSVLISPPYILRVLSTFTPVSPYINQYSNYTLNDFCKSIFDTFLERLATVPRAVTQRRVDASEQRVPTRTISIIYLRDLLVVGSATALQIRGELPLHYCLICMVSSLDLLI